MTDLTPIAGKLSMLVRMLSSDKDGEVLGAAAAIIRTLKSAGADIHSLADAIEKPNRKLSEAAMKLIYDSGFQDGLAVAEKKQHGNDDFRNVDGSPCWEQITLFCQERDDRLRDNEREFVNDMAGRVMWREPTPKQGKWLKSIFFRLGGKP